MDTYFSVLTTDLPSDNNVMLLLHCFGNSSSMFNISILKSRQHMPLLLELALTAHDTCTLWRRWSHRNTGNTQGRRTHSHTHRSCSVLLLHTSTFTSTCIHFARHNPWTDYMIIYLNTRTQASYWPWLKRSARLAVRSGHPQANHH
jgi:hypothetical protein